MAKESIKLADGLPRAVEKAAEIMERGGVVIFPTETVYGVGVASGNHGALARLRRIKGRGADKPFQFLVAGMDMARAMGAVFSPRAKKLASNYWPGPMTLVVPDGAGGTLGIRIPDSPFVLALSRRLGRAIVTSSANPAGLLPPLDAAEADAFGNEADLLVDGDPVAGGEPSTVVRAVGDEYEILRQGGIAEEAVDAAWNE